MIQITITTEGVIWYNLGVAIYLGFFFWINRKEVADRSVIVVGIALGFFWPISIVVDLIHYLIKILFKKS